MDRFTTRRALVALIAAAAAWAPPAHADAERVRVCAEQLELNREPNHGWDGVLHEGETFAVRKLSDSGKYAYGLAYGHINRVGWVRTAGLCGTGQARAAVAEHLVGERIAVCDERLTLTIEPNRGWDGVLRRGETVDVRKLSESGKYAYGLAYGHINRVGWVKTAGLCGGA